eukprot:gnl/TRDRNA2_/TRDRNA2_90765_c0_seq1.p1 gnl/TRDRNA2_/TRDRNA2_90765_c0~~gnl/TRDRNA2_/TRDRNA2_90765_c0_seq1.p1  ORF type:complete len:457 (-),score=56.87 gnl/TRDRNA2_/TRDRNA2_90765_c0_seq1:32-1402(-)
MAALPVKGYCAPGFEAVKTAFQQNFDEGVECGSSLSVYHHGRCVVNLWGGVVDVDGAPWRQDTLTGFFSVTKGLSAICMAMLVDRGLLDYDKPVATYWPEFAQNGKADITVACLLSHKAGLCYVPWLLPDWKHPKEDMFDWEKVTAALAAMKPLWTPGSQAGYHANSYAYLVGELCRRVSGKTIGTFLQHEVCGPLGADVFIGVPESELHRCATSQKARRLREDPAGAPKKGIKHPASKPKSGAPGSEGGRTPNAESQLSTSKMNSGAAAVPIETWKAFHFPIGPNNKQWMTMELCGSNGHGTAAGVARIYAALACGGELDGVRLMSPGTISRLSTEEFFGTDLVAGPNTGWGRGLMINNKDHCMFGPNPSSFGNPGLGGNLGMCDPMMGLALAYVHNRPSYALNLDDRGYKLVEAIYKVLKAPIEFVRSRRTGQPTLSMQTKSAVNGRLPLASKL